MLSPLWLFFFKAHEAWRLDNAKNNNFLFLSVLLCANCAIVHADPEFTTPIDDGKVILNFNEKSGFQKIAIQDQDAIKDLSDTMVKASANGIISGV